MPNEEVEIQTYDRAVIALIIVQKDGKISATGNKAKALEICRQFLAQEDK